MRTLPGPIPLRRVAPSTRGAVAGLVICGAGLALAAACSTAGHEPGTTRSGFEIAITAIDEAWLHEVVGSDLMKRYLAIPAGSVHLRKSAGGMLTRLAMAESFLRNPSWSRIWDVAVLEPDEFAGIAILNFVVETKPDNFVGLDLERIGSGRDTRGFEAAVFAHIEDERSRLSRFDPAAWIEDNAGYDFNAYLTCAEFLARRDQPYMAREWDRLARFERNADIRDLAERCLTGVGSRAGANEFSQSVARARLFRLRVAGMEICGVSTHEIRGEKYEEREFEIGFLGRGEPVDHHVFEMIGLRAKEVGEGGFFRRRAWPHRAAIAAGSDYLEQVKELFALLERGEPGEVRREYATFLVVRDESAPWPDSALRDLDSALPPYTRFGLVPGKRLLVFLVLNENLVAVREILRDRLPLKR